MRKGPCTLNYRLGGPFLLLSGVLHLKTKEPENVMKYISSFLTDEAIKLMMSMQVLPGFYQGPVRRWAPEFCNKIGQLPPDLHQCAEPLLNPYPPSLTFTLCRLSTTMPVKQVEKWSHSGVSE